MTHHEQNIALLQVVKGCTFGKNPPDKFVGDFTAALLVGTLRITIKDPTAHLSKFDALNGNRVGKFTATVRQNDGKQSAVLLVPKSFVQPVENLCNRPCRVPVPQKCQYEGGRCGRTL